MPGPDDHRGPDRPDPKVTPSLLRRPEDACPRRLAHEVLGEPGNADPVHRARLRDAVLTWARDAHAAHDLGLAPAPIGLTEEEDAVVEQAVHWYRHCFAATPVTVLDPGLDRPSAIVGLPARIGGWVDLVVEHADGHLELRTLDLWGSPAPADPLAVGAVQCALVRLADRSGDAALAGAEVSWTDLLHGVRRARTLGAGDLAAVRTAVADGCARVLARIADPVAEPGAACVSCRFRKGCPEFPGAKLVGRMSRSDPLPGVLTVTPTAMEAWQRCGRLWRDQHLLRVPASDAGAAGEHGRRVHALLRMLHLDGPCTDPRRIDDVVVAHGADQRVHDELHAHARRCPVGATSYGHEITRNRLHTRPPHFLASARLDAVWIHDGVLDVRDYKTGGVWHDRVADDERARVQAWIMAPIAPHTLSHRPIVLPDTSEVVDDPETWAPDADDLADLDDWMTATVAAIRGGAPWAGAADAVVCRTCRYRSICPDSALPGVPTWPRVEPDADDPADLLDPVDTP